ncbi:MULTISPECIES: glycosyltransferase family 2 protein [Bacillaceae]|uniref:Glycosyltransferase n=1 Tax=Evansella alkalicola TaxID=745819 RepID=A0ABS6JXG5_9BACI|nr:glycosyltransferase family 2 protein [Litchfieldia alkalitelluris]MBU9723085.1 glycosyltransferase [Bacillus alkalicola]
MSNILISIVLPTFKRPDKLEKAINSILNQTYENWELLVIDDNGESNIHRNETEEFMERYKNASKIRYLKHAKNKGGGAARNTGILSAKADYIAFLDDDDEWLPNKLEKQVKQISFAKEDVAVFDTGRKVIKTSDKHNYKHEKIIVPVLRGYIFDDLLVKNGVRAPKLSTVICKKYALINVGLFDESLPSRQDLDLYIRLAREYKYDFIEEPLVIINIHQDRITNNPEAKVTGFDILYKKIYADLVKLPKIHSTYLVQYAEVLLRAGNKKKAEYMLINSIKLNPLNKKAYITSFLYLLGLYNFTKFIKKRIYNFIAMFKKKD